MIELIVTGVALEPPRMENVTKHGEQMPMMHFYFDFDKVRDDDGNEVNTGKAQAMHVMYFGKRTVEIVAGTSLKLYGRFDQCLWTTRENGNAIIIQDFIAHKIEGGLA